jgi:type VI secretion system Hcp family effector
MALEAYILTAGFEGTTKKFGHPAKASIVHSVYHELTTPIDNVHGAVTGRRAHGLLHVELVVDASIHQYYTACIDKDKGGAKKLDVEVGFYRTDQANVGLKGFGEEKTYYKINLKDAFVASITFTMGDRMGGTTANPGSVGTVRSEYIKVSFAYREIHWLYCDGNKEAMDKWDA